MALNYVITTVQTPAASTNLTTLLNVKTDLALSGAVPEDDIFLRRAIVQVTQAAQDYCNRTFAQQTYQDLVRPERDRAARFIPARRGYYKTAVSPLVSVTSVIEDYLGDNQTTLVQGTDFEVDLTQNAIYRLDTNGQPRDWYSYPLQVIYVAGYTLPPATSPTPLLPATVEDAVIRMLKAKWDARNRDPTLKVREVAGVGRDEFWISNTKDGAMTPDITDLLYAYRVNTVA